MLPAPLVRLPALVAPAPDLTPAEAARTARQTRLPQLGETGQRRLAAARVCILGAGGLGSPAMLYLAAAGVGTIGIIDSDVVEASNLQRQIVHSLADVGRPKVTSAAEQIRQVAPDVVVLEHHVRLTQDNAAELFSGYDLVVDGTDNFITRYLANDVCAELGMPLVWAAVLQFSAQISVFWAHPPASSGARGVQLRDLFPTPPEPGEVPSCADAGVLGAMCGQVGSLMATEAVKLITGIGSVLLGRVLLIDALAATQTEIPLRPRAAATPRHSATAENPETADPLPLDALPLTSPAPVATRAERPPMSVADLASIIESDPESVVVLDVREPSEHAESAIPGALLVPLGEILRDPRGAGVPTGVPLVVHCHRGSRAIRAAAVLQSAGYDDVTLLDGGIVAWDAAFPPASPDPLGATQ